MTNLPTEPGGFVPPGWLIREWLGLPTDTRTDEQHAADEAAYLADLKTARLVIENEHAAALNRSAGLRRAVLELHAPTFSGDYDRGGHCDGCDYGGCEAEPPEFPCRTYVLASRS